MKMVEVNGPALKAALEGVLGSQGFSVIEAVYGLLDNYEKTVRDQYEDTSEEDYAEGYADGFDAGYNQGYDDAREAFYSTQQPDVIALPDLTHFDNRVSDAVEEVNGGYPYDWE